MLELVGGDRARDHLGPRISLVSASQPHSGEAIGLRKSRCAFVCIRHRVLQIVVCLATCVPSHLVLGIWSLGNEICIFPRSEEAVLAGHEDSMVSFAAGAGQYCLHTVRQNLLIMAANCHTQDCSSSKRQDVLDDKGAGVVDNSRMKVGKIFGNHPHEQDHTTCLMVLSASGKLSCEGVCQG